MTKYFGVTNFLALWTSATLAVPVGFNFSQLQGGWGDFLRIDESKSPCVPLFKEGLSYIDPLLKEMTGGSNIV